MRPCATAVASTSEITPRCALRPPVFHAPAPRNPLRIAPLQLSGFAVSNQIAQSSRLATTSIVPQAAASAVVATEGWWTRDLPPNFHHIHSVQELVDHLAEASRDDQLVVVEYFAPWCAACKALFPKYKKICLENHDVRFVAVNFDEGKSICRTLGVKVLPFFQFYRGAEGRVAAFPASISKVAKLRDAIADYKSDRCFLEDPPAAPLAEYPEVFPSEYTQLSAHVNGGAESGDESGEPRAAELIA